MTARSPPGTRQTSPRVPGPNHSISSAVACRRCSMGCTLHRNCQVQPWTRSSLPRQVPIGQRPPSRSAVDSVWVKGAVTDSFRDVVPRLAKLRRTPTRTVMRSLAGGSLSQSPAMRGFFKTSIITPTRSAFQPPSAPSVSSIVFEARLPPPRAGRSRRHSRASSSRSLPATGRRSPARRGSRRPSDIAGPTRRTGRRPDRANALDRASGRA